jgi:cell division protein FtsB
MAFNHMRFVVRCVVAFAVLVAVVTGLLLIMPRYRHWRMLAAKRDLLEEANLAMRRELAAIKRKQTRFQEDPEFVERIARESRLIRPGETVFIFDPPPEEEEEAAAGEAAGAGRPRRAGSVRPPP